MRTSIIAALAATGLATPALAASGIAPDPASWLMLVMGATMIGLTASGRRRRTGRVAD